MPVLSEKQPGSGLCIFCSPLPLSEELETHSPFRVFGLESCSHSGSGRGSDVSPEFNLQEDRGFLTPSESKELERFKFSSSEFKVAFFCLFSQKETHLSALFARNSRRHRGKCSSTQMPNPIWFTPTKELQEDPLHKKHTATRYAQWKVWSQTEPSPSQCRSSLNDGSLPQSIKCSSVVSHVAASKPGPFTACRSDS
ncbi:hypothetical protein AMECASPLE_031169 [Ameca splendens]|uniref:Uncharacterized protein n=1 Tax=Ameca splendens TaxID=208324 RepID=A0ABV0YUH8_9TELE